MNQLENNFSTTPKDLSCSEVYDLIADLAVRETQVLLDNMIHETLAFDTRILSEIEAEGLVKLVLIKQTLIKSSFAFQFKKNFSDFKAIRETGGVLNPASVLQSTELADPGTSDETALLEVVTATYDKAYDYFYPVLTQRLLFCSNRSGSGKSNNPLHIKSLCEAFRYSVDQLKLKSRYRIALYRFFASRVLRNLTSFYRDINQCFIEHNILPHLQLTQVARPVPVDDDPATNAWVSANTICLNARRAAAVEAKAQEPECIDQIEVKDLIDDSVKMKKGDWISIRQNNKIINAKLVWKAENNSRFKFVDRTGKPVCEINNVKLRSDLKSGVISQITTSSVTSGKIQFSVTRKLQD